MAVLAAPGPAARAEWAKRGSPNFVLGPGAPLVRVSSKSDSGRRQCSALLRCNHSTRKWVLRAATDEFERRQMCSLSCIGGGGAAGGAKAANVSLSPHGSDWLERRERKKRQLCFARSFSHQPLSLSLSLSFTPPLHSLSATVVGWEGRHMPEM